MRIFIKFQRTFGALPVLPVRVYAGSALPLEIYGIPHKLGDSKVTAVSVTLTNAVGVVGEADCTFSEPTVDCPVDDSFWSVTFAPSVFVTSGTVTRGVKITATCANGMVTTIAVADLIVESTEAGGDAEKSKELVKQGDDIFLKTYIDEAGTQHYAKQILAFDPEQGMYGAEWRGDYILRDGEWIALEPAGDESTGETGGYVAKGSDIYQKSYIDGDGVQHYAKQILAFDEAQGIYGASWTGDYILRNGEFVDA